MSLSCRFGTSLGRVLSGAALCLCLAAAPPAGAQQTLTPAQMRSAAQAALAAGNNATAATLASALLRRDAADFDALLILSRAARTLGDTDIALDAATRAWDAATGDRQRFAAAMVRAQALATAERRTEAQLWLRRAADLAPDDRLRQVAVQDFRYVRARNPWSTQLTFGIAPVSNLNNGSKRDTGLYELPVFGQVEAELTGAAQALSGTEINLGVATRYRLRQSQKGRTDLIFGLDHKAYRLSDAARDKAPEARASDFAFTYAFGQIVERGQTGRPDLPYQLSATLARTWYGGDPYMQFATLSASQSWQVTPAAAWQLNLSHRRQETLGTRTADATSWDIGLGHSRVTRRGHRLSLGVVARDSRSDSANLGYDGLTLTADLALARPVLGTRLEMDLTLGRKAYDTAPVAGRDRIDHEVGLSLTAIFDQVDYFGFVPTATLFARRVTSDFGQYDADEAGLSLGIRSAF